MKKRKITKEDIKRCLSDGEIIIKKVVKGEMRYLKEVDLKHRKLIVVYTIRDGEERVITCCPISKRRRVL